MGGMMTRTEQMTEAELAEHYDTHRDADEWGESEHVERPERREVTISVRFTEREITEIRDRAEQVGMKPTAYIREVVLRTGGAVAKTMADRLSDIVGDLPALKRMVSVLTKFQEQAVKIQEQAMSNVRMINPPTVTPASVRYAPGTHTSTAPRPAVKKAAAKKTTAKKTTAKKTTAKKTAAKKTAAKKAPARKTAAKRAPAK
jgi:predicted DNA binding CopG/RHH family protein